MYPFVVSKNAGYSVSESDIAAIEERFGVKFPQALKDYYIQYNCADISFCGYVKGAEIYEIDVLEFASLTDSEVTIPQRTYALLPTATDCTRKFGNSALR